MLTLKTSNKSCRASSCASTSFSAWIPVSRAVSFWFLPSSNRLRIFCKGGDENRTTWWIHYLRSCVQEFSNRFANLVHEPIDDTSHDTDDDCLRVDDIELLPNDIHTKPHP